ncbi:Linoleate 13S-lipoxygenase 2-1 [Spatholobus suberectus]|nr:Linoleate 13S-lipoxygenase 2-1 [Spatholobus suberectus]
MIKPQVYQSQNTNQTLLFLQRPSVPGIGTSASLPLWLGKKVRRHKKVNHLVLVSRNVQTSSTCATLTGTDKTTEKSTVKVKAIVKVKITVADFFSSLRLDRGIDDITDLLGKSLLLELVSSELDPVTGVEKETLKAYAHKAGQGEESVKYETKFEVPGDFGEIGAVLVENEHHKEMFLETILLDGFPEGPVRFDCASWVHSKFDNPTNRVFFSNKCYLPRETPSGLRRLRAEELSNMRGNGEGERKSFERIYDYDIYNDIGDPDKSLDLQRPPLGGKEQPYPRRCRTGRPHSEADPLSEKRSRRFYVPRDECFSEVKQLTFSTKTLHSVLLILLPSLGKIIKEKDLAFSYFHDIDSLFSTGLDLPTEHETEKGFLGKIMPRLVKSISGDRGGHVLRFETPETMSRDRFFWFRDEEFARQTVAGLNPCSIRLVTEWPLKSKLDPEIYGPAESAITSEIIDREIGGIISVEKAIEEKKLFMLDYHDLLLPYVNKVRKLKGKTLYGSRTLFFLNPEGTLRPLAIELTRPPTNGKGQWKQVFTPSWHSTSVWLWRIAKAHALAHDSGYHQLVSHWLRTHCVTEPYVIATNRTT